MAYVADEVKKYVDYAGLKYYDELLKKFVKENGSDVTDKLIALVGAAEKGADEATILARIADLETAVGDVSELGDEVANLVKAILGEKARAEGVEGDLQDAIDALDEKLYGSDAEVEGEAVHTKGDIDKIQDRLTALEEDTSDADAVAALEERLYGKGEGEEHVDGTIDEINAAITAEEAARKAQIGELGKVSEEEDAADHTVKSYVDAAVEAINGAADDLDSRVEALEATHAKKTVGEGDDAEEVFKTVAEEVNEAVTALVDGAPDALDTLKEIADWIANQDESGVTDVASLISRVDTLSGDENTAGSVAKAQKDAEDYADSAIEDLDATVNQGGDSASAAGEDFETSGLQLFVEQEDGKIKSVNGSVNTITSDDIDALFATESNG